MSTSLINFDVVYKNPELRETAKLVQAWIEAHSYLPFFPIDQMASDLAGRCSFIQLMRVLVRLVESGELKHEYRVRFSYGEYSEEAFDSPDEIESCIFDSAFRPVAVSRENIVATYRHVNR